MNRVPVQSSNIKSIGHDPKTNTMEVEFSTGAVHQYDGVNVDEHRALMSAQSVGSHFHNIIRGSKASRKVEPT